MPEDKTLSPSQLNDALCATALKPREIQRDSEGRFDRHGKTLAKTQKKTGLSSRSINKKPSSENQSLPERHPDGRLKNGGARPGAGRPRGAKNKIPLQLREMILAALDEAGGKQYLARLAIENSSAFSSLLGKVLPTTIAASDSDGGKDRTIVFVRQIVHPDGHIEGPGIPRQLPSPACYTSANVSKPVAIDSKINGLDE